MRTANPNVDIFKTLKQAEKVYYKTPAPCALLQSRNSYFVDRCGVGEGSAIEQWPNHYMLIAKK